jgi:hypothetical protein
MPAKAEDTFNIHVEGDGTIILHSLTVAKNRNTVVSAAISDDNRLPLKA